MPANLPPDYYAAERRYRESDSPQDKIAILREMLSIMPKHKGTEHLQGDLKRKIAKLQAQAKKKQATTKTPGLDHIPREGVGQAVLVGPPNSGKSSILSTLTHAESLVADYPFSTYKPVVGMMVFEDVQVQLVDIPPVSPSHTESWVFNVVRLADLVLLTIGLSDNFPDKKVADTCRFLESHKILLKKEGVGRPQGPIAVKSTVLIGTKEDAVESRSRKQKLIDTLGDEFPCFFLSIHNQESLEELRKHIFDHMKVIRVYTKIPGKKADLENPYVLPVGTTILEAARTIHKEMADSLKYARLWGSQTYDGQRVERDHILEDKDILEIHTR